MNVMLAMSGYLRLSNIVHVVESSDNVNIIALSTVLLQHFMSHFASS